MQQNNFALLFACYRSGQISEAAWQEHLAEDEVFARWVALRLRQVG